MKSSFFAGCQSAAITAAIEIAFAEAVKERGNEVVITDAVLERFADIATHASTPDAKAGFLFHGELPGTGKTATARALFKLCEAPGKYLHAACADAIRNDAELQTLRARIAAINPIFCPGAYYNPDAPGVEVYSSFGPCANYNPDAPGVEAYSTQGQREKARPLCEQYRARRDEIAAGYTPASEPPRPVWYSANQIADMAEDMGRKSLLSALSPAAAPALFIDDFGLEPLEVSHQGNKVLPLVEVLTARYDAEAPVVITTNFAFDAIAWKYGPRISDRLIEMCQWRYFSGEYFRK